MEGRHEYRFEEKICVLPVVFIPPDFWTEMAASTFSTLCFILCVSNCTTADHGLPQLPLTFLQFLSYHRNVLWTTEETFPAVVTKDTPLAHHPSSEELANVCCQSNTAPIQSPAVEQPVPWVTEYSPDIWLWLSQSQWGIPGQGVAVSCLVPLAVSCRWFFGWSIHFRTSTCQRSQLRHMAKAREERRTMSWGQGSPEGPQPHTVGLGPSPFPSIQSKLSLAQPEACSSCPIAC